MQIAADCETRCDAVVGKDKEKQGKEEMAQYRDKEE